MQSNDAEKSAPSSRSPQREWAPRMWEGMDYFAWLRLLTRNRFRVHPSCWYIAVIITCVSFWHSFLRFLQNAWYGPAIARTPVRHAPLFIIGHWRTGTTLLHEFLILDERHTFPNTYQCLDPNHFLLSEEFMKRWLYFLMPSRRPMDNMAAGFDRPQEDEFALCMLGQPSPYLTIAFPNNPPQDSEYLDLEGIHPRRLSEWKKTFFRYLQTLTFKNPKRLVLKSPPHTARIKVLLELFPDARFIHIVRDPRIVFPSTVNLWKSLYRKHGMQKPTFAGLEEYVLTTFSRMYQRLEETRHLVRPERFYELRYEDLVKNPVDEMRRLYDHLQLDGFDVYRPRLEKYLETIKGYETNRYTMTDTQRTEVEKRWGDVIRRYGYSSV